MKANSITANSIITDNMNTERITIKSWLLHYCYQFITELLLCIGILSLIFTWNGLPISLTMFLAISFIGTLSVRFIFTFARYRITYLIIFVLCIMAGLLIFQEWEVLGPVWQDYVRWIIPQEGSIREYIELYWWFTAGMVFLVTIPLLCYLQRFFLVRKIICGIFLVFSVQLAYYHVPLKKYEIICMIIYILFVLIEWQYERNYGRSSGTGKVKQKNAMVQHEAVPKYNGSASKALFLISRKLSPIS